MLPRQRPGRPRVDDDLASRWTKRRRGCEAVDLGEGNASSSNDPYVHREAQDVEDSFAGGRSEEREQDSVDEVFFDCRTEFLSDQLDDEFPTDLDLDDFSSFERADMDVDEGDRFIDASFEELMEFSADEDEGDATDDIDDLFDSDEESEENKSSSLSNLKEKLAVWRSANNITRTAMTSLLHILVLHKPSDDFSKLNVDSRTLTKHTSTFDTTGFLTLNNCAGGTYVHFGIEDQLKNLLAFVKDKYGALKLRFGIDGLPLFKSSPKHFWPIMLRVLSVASLKEIVIPVGIWFGSLTKPDCVDEYLDEFIKEMKLLLENGLVIGGEHKQVILDGMICDAPARCFILSTAYFNGYHSCPKCKIHGDFDGRTYFPFAKCQTAGRRTHSEYVDATLKPYHKSKSPLASLPGFDIPKMVPYDFMHLICRGVQKTLLALWTAGERPHKLSAELCERISSKLVACREFVTKDFQRKPRSLSELPFFKATEFRLFLLYLGPACLKKSLQPLAYVNYLCLHVAIRILADPKLCCKEEFRNFADKLLKKFLEQFGKIYAEKFLTHNFHGLYHLVEDVKTFGALDEFSAWAFESFLGKLKQKIRKGEKALQQVIERMREDAIVAARVKLAGNLSPEFSKEHAQGPLLSECSNPQYKIVHFGNFDIMAASKAESFCFVKGKKIVCVENICWNQRLNSMVVVGRELLQAEDFFEIPCKSSLLNIYKVSRVRKSHLKVWRVSDILFKMMAVPYESSEFVMYPLLHCQC